jgi:hypothetical protein
VSTHEHGGISPESMLPGDALAAIRSFPRRFAALLTRFEEDEDPDALVRRAPEGGWSALQHAAHTRDTLRLHADHLHRILRQQRPDLGSAPDPAPAPDEAVEAVLDGLEDEAGRLAGESDRIADADWSRTGTLDGQPRDVLWVVRQAAVQGAHHLREAERAIAAARRTIR